MASNGKNKNQTAAERASKNAASGSQLLKTPERCGKDGCTNLITTVKEKQSGRVRVVTPKSNGRGCNSSMKTYCPSCMKG